MRGWGWGSQNTDSKEGTFEEISFHVSHSTISIIFSTHRARTHNEHDMAAMSAITLITLTTTTPSPSRVEYRKRTRHIRPRAAAAGGECTLDDATLKSAKLIYATSPALTHMREGHPESNTRVPAILDALEVGLYSC